MIISYSRKFIFIHIHKTGGDSIAAILRPALVGSDFVLNNDWQTWLQSVRSPKSHSELGMLGKHSPGFAIERAVSQEMWDDSFKFAFVRHPIGRAISLYKYAVRKVEERRKLLPRNAWYLTPPGRSGDPLNWPSVRAVLETESFSDFIRHPLLDKELAMFPQWYSVSDGNGCTLVDFVGRFEQLQEDFHKVQDRIGLPRATLVWRNASRNMRPKGLSVSDDDRAYLSAKFEEDFKHFGYDPSSDS